jgi:hypothetical protein
MRVWTERVYGIAPAQVIGSTGTVRFELHDGKPELTKTTDYIFVNDKAGKPAGIHEHIGRRPVMCVGNSDGDQAMLEYTTIANPRPSLGVLIHHTDGEREYRYDAEPPSTGKLISALQAAVRDPYHVATRRGRMFSAADPRSAGCNRTGRSCTRQIAVTPIAPQTARVTCFAAGARQLYYCRQKSELRPCRADNHDRANVKVSSVRALAGGAHGIVDSQLPYGLAAKAEYEWGGAVGPGSRS